MLVVASILARARSLKGIKAQHGELLQPFCGALIITSTFDAFMSTHIAPEAMQSSTNKPSTDSTASPIARKYSGGKIIPADVSTCGANTTSGFSFLIHATTSSIGGGAKAPSNSFTR